MKKIVALFLLLMLMGIFVGCYKQVSLVHYEELRTILQEEGYQIVDEDGDESILQGQRKWVTLNGQEHLSVYLYASEEEMEKDASYVSPGGTSYTNGKKSAEVSWTSYPHFYKKGNMIVLYVGEDEGIMDLLKVHVSTQFAGYTP